jgi:hypothetical protein
MTAKPKLTVQWVEVAKFIGAIVIGLGGGFGVTQVSATQATNASSSSEYDDSKLNLHTATDSVRWVYTERRLERIETMATESHEILLRIDSRLRQ